MSGATIAPALPGIHAHFSGVENADLLVRLVLTIPAFFIALGAPVAGLVVDRMGCKPMLVGSTALYVVAGGAGYVLATLPGILTGRALLGIAVGAVLTGATTLIADYYTGDPRATGPRRSSDRLSWRRSRGRISRARTRATAQDGESLRMN